MDIWPRTLIFIDNVLIPIPICVSAVFASCQCAIFFYLGNSPQGDERNNTNRKLFKVLLGLASSSSQFKLPERRK